MDRGIGVPGSAQVTSRNGEGPDLSAAALAALIRQPDFDRAMMAVAQSVLDQYRASWMLNRILSDRGRVVAAFMALDLHFAAGRGTGFTLAQLRNEAVRHGFASRGRVTAWAATLRLLGLFASGGPGRPLRLAPTRDFFAMFRARMLLVWQPIAMLHPPARRAIEALDDDAFLGRIAAGFMGPYRTGQRVFDGIPELADLCEREAGLCVLLSALLADAAADRISIAGLAREFSVSRAHIRAILGDAAKLGLFRQAPDGEFQVQPGLRDWLRRFFGALFQTHIYAIDHALSRQLADLALSE